MARPERAARWVLIVTVVVALVTASWTTFWAALAPLRELGASAGDAVVLVLFVLFFLAPYNAKLRSRRSGGGSRVDHHPHE